MARNGFSISELPPHLREQAIKQIQPKLNLEESIPRRESKASEDSTLSDAKESRWRHTISSPLFIEIGKKKRKRYHLNLNNYRNWHFIVSNNLKKAYKDIVSPQIVGVSMPSMIRLTFVLWRGDSRKIDRANVLSVHEKFCCDAMVELGCIEDDKDKYIESTTYLTGGIDKDNPRVEIIIDSV